MRLMTILTGALLGILHASPSTMASGPPDARAYQVEDHYRLRSVGDVQMSPDGSTVAFVERFIDTSKNNRSHIWLMTVAGNTLKRISAEDADDSSPRWSPDGRPLAFLTGKRAVSNNSGFLPAAFGNTIAVDARRHAARPSRSRTIASPTTRWPIRVAASSSPGRLTGPRSRISPPTKVRKARLVIRW